MCKLQLSPGDEQQLHFFNQQSLLRTIDNKITCWFVQIHIS